MRRGGPDYRLCGSAVTAYHRTAAGQVERTVYPNAYLETKLTRTSHKTAGVTVSKIGMSERGGSLLVLPWESEECPLEPGDKILRGEGPAADALDWADLNSARLPGLVVLRYTVMRYWRGKPCHLEAGG